MVNYRYGYLEDALIQQGVAKKNIDSLHINLKKLIELALPNEQIAKSTFYAAKLQMHQASRGKSLKLIQEQRALKTNLEKQRFRNSEIARVVPILS